MSLTEEEWTLRSIIEFAPRCFVCGENITDPNDAERVNRTFRVRHRQCAGIDLTGGKL